jgi:hypothetical protein
MKATDIWLVNKCTSLRGSPMRAMPSWLRGTSLPMGERRSLAGVVFAVQVRRAHRPRAEEWPYRRDVGVAVIDEVDVKVARATRTAELMQRFLVDPERGRSSNNER